MQRKGNKDEHIRRENRYLEVLGPKNGKLFSPSPQRPQRQRPQRQRRDFEHIETREDSSTTGDLNEAEEYERLVQDGRVISTEKVQIKDRKINY